MNAECNSDECVSADVLQVKSETQSELPAAISDPREQDQQGMTDVNMSPSDSVKVCDNYITQYHSYIGCCQFPETYLI
jgi:hypothetical protein